MRSGYTECFQKSFTIIFQVLLYGVTKTFTLKGAQTIHNDGRFRNTRHTVTIWNTTVKLFLKHFV
jgi:hypothetical protein